MATKHDWLRFTRAINFFILLRQRNQSWWLDVQRFKRGDRAAQLPLASVDQQNVGKRILIII